MSHTHKHGDWEITVYPHGKPPSQPWEGYYVVGRNKHMAWGFHGSKSKGYTPYCEQGDYPNCSGWDLQHAIDECVKLTVFPEESPFAPAPYDGPDSIADLV